MSQLSLSLSLLLRQEENTDQVQISDAHGLARRASVPQVRAQLVELAIQTLIEVLRGTIACAMAMASASASASSAGVETCEAAEGVPLRRHASPTESV